MADESSINKKVERLESVPDATMQRVLRLQTALMDKLIFREVVTLITSVKQSTFLIT